MKKNIKPQIHFVGKDIFSSLSILHPNMDYFKNEILHLENIESSSN